MSGISSRLINDSCAISQHTKTSCAPGEYSLFLDYHINPNFKNSKDVPCASQAKTVGCAPCNLNSNATVALGPQSFVQLAEIEDNLRGVKRNLTLCANSKFASCDIVPNAANRIQGECTNNIVMNPNLCDRSIVPTNLKFPTSKGF
jgi:hypothetical protein